MSQHGTGQQQKREAQKNAPRKSPQEKARQNKARKPRSGDQNPPKTGSGASVNVRALAAQTLAPVIEARASLPSTLPPGLETRDRGLYRAICFGVCRALPQLEALALELLRTPFKKRDADIQALLLTGLYQLFHMRIPAHAAVGETAGGARALGKSWATRVLNGCLRRADREREALLKAISHRPEACHWHPLWLATRLERAWPAHFQAIVAANNHPGPMTLRVNRRHLSRQAYAEQLAEAGLESRLSPFAADGLMLETPCDVTALPGFEAGRVSVQDEAAQLAAPLLATALADHKDGAVRLLDACSAPGGKSAHLLECLPNASLLALDSDLERLSRVEQTLARQGLDASVRQADAAATATWWDGVSFDAILLDAPCSGTGVIRRHPDIKRLRRDEDIEALGRLQARLLNALWPTLARGGVLLYATCSVLPEENARQVEAFLARTADARSVTPDADWGMVDGPGRQLFPDSEGHDGFFYALLQKNDA